MSLLILINFTVHISESYSTSNPGSYLAFRMINDSSVTTTTITIQEYMDIEINQMPLAVHHLEIQMHKVR